jgi:hypothetical protein
MKKLFFALQLAVLPLFLGVLMLPGKAFAWDSLACYQLKEFPNERYKLLTRNEGDLTTFAEETNFNHPHQIATTVVGKHVSTCGDDTVRPVAGSLIATDPLAAARLGLKTFSTTGVPTTCRDLSISCSATDVSAFPYPTYSCFGRNDFGTEFAITLVKVDESTDPRCSLFEDGNGKQAPLLGLGITPQRSTGGPLP